MGAEDSSGPGSFSGNELNWLNNEIHLLDHRKGEAEKALARIIEEAYCAEDRARNCQRLREAEEKIRKMEELHDEYVERLGVLRDRIVTEMDKFDRGSWYESLCLHLSSRVWPHPVDSNVARHINRR